MTRLFVLIARRAPVAVVFRRGPSKRVLLVRSNLSEDSFEAGQWLKGRVYERRCDLSADGERLIFRGELGQAPPPENVDGNQSSPVLHRVGAAAKG